MHEMIWMLFSVDSSALLWQTVSQAFCKGSSIEKEPIYSFGRTRNRKDPRHGKEEERKEPPAECFEAFLHNRKTDSPLPRHKAGG